MGEKMKLRVEVSESDGIRAVRPHRAFYGHSKTAHVAELEYDEDERIFAFFPVEGEELQGRSTAVPEAGGIVLTSDPSLYGTDDDRRASGKMPLKRLSWGEWNMVGDFPEGG
ncbi:MAG: hypothetical protein BWY99_00379 [Synergistetes bacterium ADurb.BinA166]|nr:MAG: hypothetical protein BWY99_00379 [Synergistetes bacterium ADurb.BinA166]